MKKLILACLAVVLIIIACKKENNTPEEVITTSTTATTATTSTTGAVLDTPEKVIEIKTPFGTMYMWLYKETPLHRANFLALADSGYFDSTTFHRCVTDFVIQGGDPNSKDADSTNDGEGGPSYTIPAEIKLKHTYGAVGAARDDNPDKASSGSQFYIVLPKKGTSFLNGEYTVFGKILKGMEVAEQIVAQPKNAKDRPYTNIRMDVNVVEKTKQQLLDEFGFTP
jgi:cyclophilin family peptidyl-prolyl cis-trans isomerase